MCVLLFFCFFLVIGWYFMCVRGLLFLFAWFCWLGCFLFNVCLLYRRVFGEIFVIFGCLKQIQVWIGSVPCFGGVFFWGVGPRGSSVWFCLACTMVLLFMGVGSSQKRRKPVLYAHKDVVSLARSPFNSRRNGLLEQESRTVCLNS